MKTLRNILAALAILLLLALAAMQPLLGIAPTALPAALDLATGMASQLACTGRYLSGLDAQQVVADLESYSPAFALVDLDYDDQARRVRASLGALASQSASYRDGLGCTRNLPGTGPVDQVRPPQLDASDAPWPAGSRVDTVNTATQAALAERLDADNAAGYQTRALVMVRGGQIVAEAAAADFSTATPLLGWSMGKSVTAILLGLLEGSGGIAVTESDLFDEWRGDRRAAITVTNLLQMSSGLEFDEGYEPGTDATRMLFASPSAAAVAVDKPLRHEPGAYFSYSSGTTNLLARLLHTRLGGDTQSTLDFMWQRLFAPLGIRSFVLEPDASGVFVGSSFVYGSARDWARLGLLMLNGGEVGGRRLLSEDWVRRAVAPNTSGNDPRYGYQFWLNAGGDQPLRWPDLPADAYAMLGNRGQVVMIIPSLDTVLVRLGWSAVEYPTNDSFSAMLAPPKTNT